MLERIYLYLQSNTRRLILVGAAVLVLLALLLRLVQTNNAGTLVVNTNDLSNSVEVRKEGEPKNLVQANGGLRASLPAGNYIVVVSNKTSSKRQLATIKRRLVTTYTINLQAVSALEPVLPFGAFNVWANGSEMLYGDMRDHWLYKIEGDKPPAPIGQSIAFENVQWQSSDRGVGLGEDGNLYSVSGNNVSRLSLPIKRVGSYSLSHGGKLVITDGESVYLSVGGSFQQIYTANHDKIASLKASDKNIFMLFASKGGDSGAAIIDMSGKIVGEKEGLGAYTYSWAPDGKRLVATSDDKTVVYSSRFSEIAELPDPNVLGLTWLNDHTILYAIGSSLLSYDLIARQSSQLATTEGAVGVAGIYPGADGSSIYVLTEAPGSDSPAQGYGLSRVSLLGRRTPDYIYQLGVFLPVTLEKCTASYINFSKPIVLLLLQDSSAAQDCELSAKATLANDRVDITDIDRLLFYTQAAYPNP